MCLVSNDIRSGFTLRLSVGSSTLEHMFDKFSQALALMGEAFEDAQTGATYLACVDLAAEVDGAQRVINAACAVQALSLIHISEPTRRTPISYAVFCLKK